MEIKFRGKRLDNGKIVYGGYHEHIEVINCPMDTPNLKNTVHMIITDVFADWNMPVPINGIPVDKKTIEQYSNYRDSDGYEVWQGDRVVLIYEDWFAEAHDSMSDIGIVDFENGCFIIRIEGSDFTPNLNNTFCKSIKCLGETQYGY